MMQPPAAAGEPHHHRPPPPQWPGLQYGFGFNPYAPPPHSLPVYCHYAPPPAAGGGFDSASIWVGDLHYWMDENYLHSCFGHTGELISTKVIRNKQTGQSEGYGFVEFCSRATAEMVLQTFNGHPMPNAVKPFRLNWASFSVGDKHSDATSDHSIFVGDLALDVTDTMLQETFVGKYPSVKGAKVVIDANTGRSKGYGFVRFGDDSEKENAMIEMNGVHCANRPMRIGAATPRKSSGFCSNGSFAQGFQPDGDSTNTTVFVGGLDTCVSEDELRETFSQFGEITSVKIPVGKQCGFVQFVHRNNAEEALWSLNGTLIGKQAVRLSWGRNPANKQSRADRSSPWNGLYYGPQIYGGYGLAFPPHDPMMYSAAYGTYPIFGDQQQVS